MATEAEVMSRTAEEKRALAQRFDEVADRWKQETAVFSSHSQIRAHPGFAQIVSMGSDAIPLLLDRLKKPSIKWMIALTAIVGDSPVKEANAGRIDAMAADWLAWGEAHGYEMKQ